MTKPTWIPASKMKGMTTTRAMKLSQTGGIVDETGRLVPISEIMDEIKKLKAEVERLREALEGFIYVYEHNGIDDDFAAYEAGKRALRGEGEK